MIRVAYVVSTLKRCGPNNQLRSIIRHLDRDCFSPVVITLSPEPIDSVKPLFEQDGVPVFSLNLSRVKGLLMARCMLRKLLHSERIGLLHTQGLRADGLSASLQGEWKGVCSVRNFPQLDYPMTYGSVRGRWMARSHTRALRRIAAPVGVSEAVSRNLEDRFGVHSRTIRNGVETSVWTPGSAQERSALREKLDLAEGESVWVSVGHLSERKDPLAVIGAFRAAHLQNARLVFLGGGPQEEACRRAAEGCAQILLAGRVENVSDWLRVADAFVSASHAEGFPNAVLEALACGLPCVLSDIAPHVELAEQAGDCIGLFAEGDESGMAHQLEQFNPDASLRISARAAAEMEFSAQATSERYQMIYRELTEGVHHA